MKYVKIGDEHFINIDNVTEVEFIEFKGIVELKVYFVGSEMSTTYKVSIEEATEIKRAIKQ